MNWLKRHLGILIVDWSVSVYWVITPAGPLTSTPIGDLAYPSEKSFGITFGLCFFSFDKNGDSVAMLSLFDGVQSDFDWAWGTARILPEGSDLDRDTLDVSDEAILVAQSDGSFAPVHPCTVSTEPPASYFEDPDPTLPYMRGQDDVLTTLMEEGVPDNDHK